MDMNLKLHRGLDLSIKGSVPSDTAVTKMPASDIAIIPDDFPGFLPKLDVKEGDSVVAGMPLMHDKTDGRVVIVSPANGTIKAVVRGERRKIMRVEITCDKQVQDTRTKIDTADIRMALMQSGLWVMMRQRPYDIVPQPDSVPVNIFVTAFDSSPLAPSLTDIVAGRSREIAAGVKALSALTEGNIYIGIRPNDDIQIPAGAERVTISGPHPAGNAGVQAALIAPVNKGETIWTLDIITLARIGEMMLHGAPSWDTTVAVTGPDVKSPALIQTTIGACVAPLLSGNITDTGKHHRIISGNVLTGIKISDNGYLRYPYRQITVMAEGDDVDEFMGWASLSPSKMSTNRSFLSWLMPKKQYAPDARLLGGRRAMIMSELYDKVMPMDIMPEYLIKAILARDIDRMEALGIYEVAPEDFALCEYVDPSKLELQKIVREGLDYLRKELA